MNKKYILPAFILILSLVFPFIVMKIQDTYVLHDTVPIADTQTQEILREHPIITSLYQRYYGFDETTDSSRRFLIREPDAYTEEEFAKMRDIQALFSNEINLFMEQGMITSDLLERDSEETFEVTFGTLTIHENREFHLDQVYRMWENNDYKKIVFSMEPKTEKIVEMEVSQQKEISYSEKQLQDIAFQMIQYLELDDIDDWTYYQNGYESNKAKLRVAAEVEEYGGIYSYHVSVRLLGMNDRYHIKSYDFG